MSHLHSSQSHCESGRVERRIDAALQLQQLRSHNVLLIVIVVWPTRLLLLLLLLPFVGLIVRLVVLVLVALLLLAIVVIVLIFCRHQLLELLDAATERCGSVQEQRSGSNGRRVSIRPRSRLESPLRCGWRCESRRRRRLRHTQHAS
jgi:hypothetical protein